MLRCHGDDDAFDFVGYGEMCCFIPYLHGLNGLRPRVVKLSSLTNRKTTRAQNKHLRHLHSHSKQHVIQ